MEQKKPKVSVLLVNYNQKGDLKSVINSLKKHFEKEAEYLVFNNSKEKLVFEGVAQYSKDKNIGYAAAINYLSKKAKGEYLLILNPDSEIKVNPKRALEVLTNNTKYKLVSLSKTNNVLYHTKEKRFSSCAFIIQKSTFLKLGGFDEHFFMYFEDDDFSLKLKKQNIQTLHPKLEYIKHKRSYRNESSLKRKLLYSTSQLYFLYKNNFLIFLFFLPLIFFRIISLKLIINLDKILFVLFGLSLVAGLYPNALGILWKIPTPFSLLDASMLLIFLRSLFVKIRNKKFDLFLLVFLTFNFTLLIINYFSYLFSFSSVMYLLRFFVYLFSYSYFTKLFQSNEKFVSKAASFLIPFSAILNLGIFGIFRNLEILGFDPHKGRLYGQFLDPNFYGVFLLIMLLIYLGISKKLLISIWITYFTTSLMLFSVFLTYSRLSFLISMFLCFILFLKYKNKNFMLITFGGVLMVLTNYDYLIRLFFVEGNYQSFIFRIQNLIEGLFIFDKNIIPTGFNNILIYNYYLNSTLSNSTSYFSFFPNNLFVSMGIFGALFLFSVVYCFYSFRISSLSSRFSYLLFFLTLFSSFFINVFFNIFFLSIFCVFLGFIHKNITNNT